MVQKLRKQVTSHFVLRAPFAILLQSVSITIDLEKSVKASIGVLGMASLRTRKAAVASSNLATLFFSELVSG